MPSANLIFLCILFFAVSLGGAMLLSRLITYLCDLPVVTWLLLILGSVALLFAIAVVAFDKGSLISSFVVIGASILGGIGVGTAMGAARTLRRGGRHSAADKAVTS